MLIALPTNVPLSVLWAPMASMEQDNVSILAQIQIFIVKLVQELVSETAALPKILSLIR